jgi:type VI secretion system protein ImpM
MKVGFFGKLPGYGDFIQRNVSPDFVNLWDNWLLQSIKSSREQLADGWRANYFNSPIWRFVIGNGALGNIATTGLMMPSVDKSGRCYPFTVICQSDEQVNPFIFARKTDPYHDNGEDFILSLLEKERPDLDDISNVLSDIYNDVQESAYKSISSKASSSVMEIAAISDNDLDDFGSCNETLLETLLGRQNIDISIWSMNGIESTNSQKRYFSGMPPVDNYYSFLVGAENQ